MRANKQIIKVTYTGCGHTVTCTSESIANKTLECTGDCPRCKNAPLLVYLFEGTYHVHMPADMQPQGMGALGIPTPYTSESDSSAVVQVVERQYPMRRVLPASVISPARYDILKRHGYVFADEHDLEFIKMQGEGATELIPFMVRQDATDPECAPMEGTPFLDDSHVTFEEVDAAIRRSQANCGALAGYTVAHYATSEHSAFSAAKRKSLTVIVLPEQLPPTRINGEPYRFALVKREK